MRQGESARAEAAAAAAASFLFGGFASCHALPRASAHLPLPGAQLAAIVCSLLHNLTGSGALHTFRLLKQTLFAYFTAHCTVICRQHSERKGEGNRKRESGRESSFFAH